MIRQIHIDNFKSVKNLTLPFNGNLTCLVGQNGSGKSTLLQALSFMSSIMTGSVEEWLDRRDWSATDLRPAGSLRNPSAVITLKADLESDGRFLRWSARFNTQQLRCTSEEILSAADPNFQNPTTLLKLQDGRLKYGDRNHPTRIEHVFKGSILSSILDELLPKECRTVKEEIASIRSMDLLSPQDMRARSRYNPSGEIGDRGERIAGVLGTLSQDEINSKIIPTLKNFFPSVVGLRTRKKQGGWIEFLIKEKFGDKEIETVGRQCNDGLLRMLAIIVQEFKQKGLLCFDEIENGISIDVLSELTKHLSVSRQQILLTTHSIVALNFIAPEDIHLIYKDGNGYSKLTNITALPTMRRHAEWMDPGDALSMASLATLSTEARQQSSE